MISLPARRGLGLIAAVVLSLALVGCGGTSSPPPTATSEAPPSGHRPGNYKVGAPYQIDGTWYYPREDYDYDERGVASWYGPDFDGKMTANGEIYNMNDLTAAHRTLPLPCLVRVTNLENGKSLVLRVNDRGPFAKARIIDVSKRAADLLGFHQAGTTHVRVQILAEESRNLKAEMVTASGDMPRVTAAPTPALVSQPLPPAAPPPQSQQQQQQAPPVSRSTNYAVVPAANAAEVAFASPMWVQAAAYRDLAQATDLQQRLLPLGNVSISQASVGGGAVYRVRLGPVTTQSQANKLLAALRSQGITDARLVSN